jgi:hypothetical protein
METMILHGSLRPTSRPLGLPILLTDLIGSIPTRPVVCFGPRVDALGERRFLTFSHGLPGSMKSVLTPPLAPAVPIIHEKVASPRDACFLRSPGAREFLGGDMTALKKSAASVARVEEACGRADERDRRAGGCQLNPLPRTVSHQVFIKTEGSTQQGAPQFGAV